MSETLKINYELTNMIKSKFIDLHSTLASSLSDCLMKEFNELLSNEIPNVTVNKHTFNEAIPVNEISKTFENMWLTAGLDERFTDLEVKKINCANNEDAIVTWNPTGKSAQQQTRWLRVKILERKIDFLKAELEKQQDELSGLFQEIVDKRNELDVSVKKRNLLNHQIDMKYNDYPEYKTILNELRVRLHNLDKYKMLST